MLESRPISYIIYFDAKKGPLSTKSSINFDGTHCEKTHFLGQTPNPADPEPQDTLRAEYPAELIKSGTRGKFVNRYREGTNIVVVSPELHKLFPDSDAVNNALRQYAKEHGMALV